MNVLLVDDESLQLNRLHETAKKVLPVGTLFNAFTNPGEALNSSKDINYDIAFLDIEMPELNGVRLAKKLKESNPKINIIFITAYDNYAFDAYKMHASGYVTKPVSEEKIKTEMNALRYDIPLKSNKKIQVKCFGNFEIFHNGEPVKFQRSKSKELLAYLIDREGSAINVNELNAVLWEEDKPSYLRNLIADIQTTLKAIGAEDVFIKRHNECFVDIDKIDCDAYEYKANNPEAIRMYRGEYMIQYSWGMFDAND